MLIVTGPGATIPADPLQEFPLCARCEYTLSHSRTQATVALSSGGAELYAIGSGTAYALFVRSLVEESKIFQKANRCVFTDSNVGQSIASRFSASRKTKHVELRIVYVQELVASGMVRIKKVLGKLNPADILKYIAKDTLHRHLPTFGFAMRFSHPPLRVCGLPLFPRRTQTRKKMTLRVERTTFLRTCPFHACTDMYFCLCSSTCLRLSLVLGIFRFSRNQL